MRAEPERISNEVTDARLGDDRGHGAVVESLDSFVRGVGVGVGGRVGGGRRCTSGRGTLNRRASQSGWPGRHGPVGRSPLFGPGVGHSGNSIGLLLGGGDDEIGTDACGMGAMDGPGVGAVSGTGDAAAEPMSLGGTPGTTDPAGPSHAPAVVNHMISNTSRGASVVIPSHRVSRCRLIHCLVHREVFVQGG